MGRGESDSYTIEEVERYGVGGIDDLDSKLRLQTLNRLARTAARIDVARRTTGIEAVTEQIEETATTAMALSVLSEEPLAPSAKKFLNALARIELLPRRQHGTDLTACFHQALTISGAERTFTSHIVRNIGSDVVHLREQAKSMKLFCGESLPAGERASGWWQERMARSAFATSRRRCTVCEQNVKALPDGHPLRQIAEERKILAGGIDANLTRELADTLRETTSAYLRKVGQFDLSNVRQLLVQVASNRLAEFALPQLEAVEWEDRWQQLWEFELLADDFNEALRVSSLRETIEAAHGSPPPEPTHDEFERALQQGIATGIRRGRYVFLRALASKVWPEEAKAALLTDLASLGKFGGLQQLSENGATA